MFLITIDGHRNYFSSMKNALTLVSKAHEDDCKRVTVRKVAPVTINAKLVPALRIQRA